MRQPLSSVNCIQNKLETSIWYYADNRCSFEDGVTLQSFPSDVTRRSSAYRSICISCIVCCSVFFLSTSIAKSSLALLIAYRLKNAQSLPQLLHDSSGVSTVVSSPLRGRCTHLTLCTRSTRQCIARSGACLVTISHHDASRRRERLAQIFGVAPMIADLRRAASTKTTALIS